MIVDYVFHITHDLSISALGHASLLVDCLCILFKDRCGLRMQYKGNREKTLSDFQPWITVAFRAREMVP